MKAKLNRVSVAFFVQIFIILLLIQTSIFGVPKGAIQPWSKPGGLGDVSLFNGVLNMGIPLINIGGRGDSQIPLVLRLGKRWKNNYYAYVEPNAPNPYSSHAICSYFSEALGPDRWNCVNEQGLRIDTVTNPEPVKVLVFPRPEDDGALGDSSLPIGYGPGFLTARTQVLESGECHIGTNPSQYTYSYEPRITRFTMQFVTADGNSHELIDKNTYGNLRAHPYDGPCSQANLPYDRGNTFISTDGSGMTFVSDTAVTADIPTGDSYGVEYAAGMTGTLYTAEGSLYRIVEGFIEWIKDRNGNKTTFTYYPYGAASPYSPKRLHTTTDSIGRTVTIDYDVQDVQPYGLCDRITYKGIGGQDQVIRISKTPLGNVLRTGYTLQTPSQMWSIYCNVGCNNYSLYNPTVASALWLPDGTSYKFQYNNFVEVARAELPTGAAVEYDHDYAITTPTDYEKSSLARVVKEQRVYADGSNSSTLQSKTKYSRTIQTGSPGNTATTVDQTDASNNLLSRQVSYFYGDPKFGMQNDTSGSLTPWREGLKYQTDHFANDGTTLLRRVLTDWKNTVIPTWAPSYNQDLAPSYDTRPTKQVLVTIENGNALAVLKKTEYDENGSADPAYFSHLNLKRSKAYNYKVLDLNTAQNASLQTIVALFSENDLVSVSETDYSYDPNYKARGILGLPLETRILNPSNVSDVLAKSQPVYDEITYFDNNYTTTNWEDPGSNLRGNVTTARTWVKDTNTWLESHAMFDNFGNARKVWDTSGDPSRFIETEYDPVYKYAYPTKTKAPAPDPTGVHGMTEGSEISRVYDFNTGLLVSVTDANGQTATTEYDALLRPIRINPPAGGSVSETIYNDTPGNIWVKSRQQIDENNWAESTTYFDNLGRAVKARTKDLQGDVMSQVRFDSFGRVEKTSNPYRVDAGGNPTETVYWSKLRYDEANRVVETFAPAPEGQTGISLGTAQFGISTLPNLVGTYATAIDPSGRKSRAISGIYGLMRVDEATGKGGAIDQDLGTLANPTQPTYYDYNIKGEMTKITQGSQNRYFMYDSLGRLIRVRQPEQIANPNLATSGNPENNQWTAGYTYDVLGNVVSVTDAKNITITNFYDKAGRTTKRTYSEGTPQVEYFYDGKGLPQVPQFSRGSLTKVTSSVSEDRFTSFDNHGRLLASQQITDGQTYNFGYKYNLSGGLLEETYPSGRIVRNFLDNDGGLSAVTSKAANGLVKQVASDFDYSATGSVRKMKLGNGLWETTQFNELQQLTQVGLGTTQTNNSLFKVDYEYGELNADGTTVDTVKNIGNIAKTTTTIPTTNFVQTFKYDSINRLTEAIEKTGATQNWKQTFGYDKFGNRTSRYQIIGSDVLPINNITHPTIDQTNNRFTTGQGYVYDLNGNLIQDSEGRSFTFNGDDKQTEVRNTGNQIIGQYAYDGSGARVKKVVPSTGETTVFVYDADGALAAEYSTVIPINPTTSYLTTDHLGSPRVITDKNGQVVARRDFMPFGEELGAGVGPRTESLKYSYIGSDKGQETVHRLRERRRDRPRFRRSPDVPKQARQVHRARPAACKRERRKSADV